MQIQVKSEVGQLREVLVHRPGQEIVRMTQYDLERMLFDDILAPSEAVIEHDMMAGIMRAAGATPLEAADLLRDAIEAAPADAVEALVHQCCQLAGATGVAEVLLEWTPTDLAAGLIEGVYWDALHPSLQSLARIGAERKGRPFALRPLPNLMFLRDPCISIYDRVVRGMMASSARAREPLVVAFALAHAPATSASLSFSDDSSLDESFYALEGGDVLVLSPRLLMIGCSQRTNPHTLERLARDGLFPVHPELERVYAVFMPQARSVMHLDTILTQIDRTLFLGHAPLIAGGPGGTAVPLARLERDKTAESLGNASVLDVLREEIGADVDFVACGGKHPLHQEREQWTDGANAVALAPGKILLYARNRWTVGALAEQGFEEVRLSVEQGEDERTSMVAEAMNAGRTVYTFSGSELSRARGGGRCLTMPLRRDPP